MRCHSPRFDEHPPLDVQFAELQALNRLPMTMASWIAKLDDFLRLSDRQILTHAGKISHESAQKKADAEFEQFKQLQAALPQPVDEQFARSLKDLKQVESQAKETQKKVTGKPTPKKAAKKAKAPGERDE